jgi:glucose-6-phosphate 1-dehydrogenase
MTAMEPPISFDADAVRSKKAEVIQAIHPIDPAHVLTDAVRGQYDAGSVLGKPVRAYRQEPDVAPNSTTETFVACKLNIDNWRWAGVPFYLRTGKYMTRRSTEIAIRFHQAPYALFRGTNVERMHPNWMILRSDDVKAQAAAVTDSYNNEGFAKAMETFILGSAR